MEGEATDGATPLEEACGHAENALAAVYEWVPEDLDPQLARAKATATSAATDLRDALELARARTLQLQEIEANVQGPPA